MATISKRTYTIRIADDFVQLLTIMDSNDVPINLTGYNFKMQIRKCKDDATLIYQLTNPTTIDMTDAANGNIILKIPAASTALFKEQNAVFDLVWTTTANIVTTILQGNIEILQRVTKP